MLRSISVTGGAQLWANALVWYEFARSACLSGVQDQTSTAVRNAYACALARIAFAASSEEAKKSIAAAGSKTKHQNLQLRSLAAVPDQCLLVPFAEAAARGDRTTCSALVQAWGQYLTSLRLACGKDEKAFIPAALKPLQALSLASSLAGNAPEPPAFGAGSVGDLGIGYAHGERPFAQACVLYIMRSSVIEQLGETGQRAMLEEVLKCLSSGSSSSATAAADAASNAFEVIESVGADGSGGAGDDRRSVQNDPSDSSTTGSVIANPLAIPFPPPVSVCILALELVALLTEALGELGPEVATSVERCLSDYVCASSLAVRTQAASAFAAIAVAEPSHAAKWLAASLRNLRTAADALVDEAYNGPDRSKVLFGTPRGTGTLRLKPHMDALEGWSMAAASLLASVARLPLGVPSHYVEVAFQIAAALIEAPRATFAPVKCLERECGYLLFGSLARMALPVITVESKCLAPRQDDLVGTQSGDAEPFASSQKKAPPSVDLNVKAEQDAQNEVLKTGNSRNLDEGVFQTEGQSEGWGPGGTDASEASRVEDAEASTEASTMEGSVDVASGEESCYPSKSPAMNGILSFWRPALGLDSVKDLCSCLSRKESEQTLAMELWWRAVALQSLEDYLLGLRVLERSQHAGKDIFKLEVDFLKACEAVAAALVPLAHLTSTTDILVDPSRVRSGPSSPLAGAIALFQLRLCRVCALLPSEVITANASLMAALVHISIVGLKLAASSGIVELLREGLRLALDYRDKPLGPWNVGKDPLERSMLLFSGMAGSPFPSCWDAGQRNGIGYGVSEKPTPMDLVNKVGVLAVHSYYPQSQTLASSLFSLQSYLLSVALLASMTTTACVDFLESIIKICDSTAAAKSRKEKNPERRLASLLAISVPILFAFGRGNADPLGSDQTRLITIGQSELGLRREFASRIQKLAESTAEEDGPFKSKVSSLLLYRTAANLFSAASLLNDDGSSINLIHSLCHRAAETPSLGRRSVYALAIGAVARSLGGLGLSSVLPRIVETLIALIKASDLTIAPILLHTLTECVNASGPAFVPHVSAALGVARYLLLSEGIYSLPGLLPAVGRLSNAIVAALGPEYVLGSEAYEICRSVVTELRALDPHGVRLPEDAVASALESVLYAQMIVLFAPNALPTSQHVSVLVNTLPSRQPQLRKAAADTLRHLAERDPVTVLSEKIEPALLAAFDGETDPRTAHQLQATLETLLREGAPRQPSRWINLCEKIINAKLSQDFSVPDPQTSGIKQSSSSLSSLEEEEEDVDGKTQATVGSRMAPPPPTSVDDSTSGRMYRKVRMANGSGALTPRLRTRLFTARCLLRIPELVLTCGGDFDQRHLDYARAQSDPLKGDWLVLQAENLVEVGFRMTTGQLEALRGLGVNLLLILLEHLGECLDPLAPGELLLAQFQAQYVSTLRSSLASAASPDVQAAGSALAAAFLEKGLAGNDATVLGKLLGLLCAPLSNWLKGLPDPAQAAYAEWVAAGARVALLESHAHCVVAALSEQVTAPQVQSSTHHGDRATVRDTVIRSQGPFFTLLIDCWIGLLHDVIVLLTRPEKPVQEAYRLSLFGRQGKERAPTLSKVADGVHLALQRAWPVVLVAAAKTLVQDRTAAYGPPGKLRHGALLDLAMATVMLDMDDTSTAESAERSESSDDRGQIHRSKPFENTMRSLEALSQLTTNRFAKEGWLTLHFVRDVVSLLRSIMHKVHFYDARNLWIMECGSSKSREEIVRAMAKEIATVLENVSNVYLFDAFEQSEKSKWDVMKMDILSAIQTCCKMRAPGSSLAIVSLNSLLAASRNMFESAQPEERNKFLCFFLSLALQVIDTAKCSDAELNLATHHVAEVVRRAAILSLSVGSGCARDLSQENEPSSESLMSAAAVTAVQQAIKYGAIPDPNIRLVKSNIMCCLSLASIAVGDVSEGRAPATTDTDATGTSQEASRVEGSMCDVETNEDGVAPEASPLGYSDGLLSGAKNNDRKDTMTLGGSSKGQEGGIEAATVRFDGVDYSKTLIATADGLSAHQQCSPAQQACIFGLRELLSALPSAGTMQGSRLRAATIQALCQFLEGHPPPIWAAQCASTALSLAASQLYLDDRFDVADADREGECVAVLNLGVLTCELGGGLQQPALDITVPLAIDSASSLVGGGGSDLIDAAVGVLTALAKGSIADAFKSTVARLPEEMRQKLQQVLTKMASSAISMEQKMRAKRYQRPAERGLKIPMMPLQRFS